MESTIMLEFWSGVGPPNETSSHKNHPAVHEFFREFIMTNVQFRQKTQFENYSATEIICCWKPQQRTTDSRKLWFHTIDGVASVSNSAWNKTLQEFVLHKPYYGIKKNHRKMVNFFSIFFKEVACIKICEYLSAKQCIPAYLVPFWVLWLLFRAGGTYALWKLRAG